MKRTTKKGSLNSQNTIPFPEMELTFADFFCGCGGFSLGFIQAGLKCVSAMDIAPDALHSYWYNLCYKGWSHFWVDPQNPNLKKMRKENMWNNGETSNKIFSYIPDNWLSPAIKEPMPCLNVFMYDIMDLEPEAWMQMCRVRPGDVSIFIGGPPCQGFSTANSNRHLLDARNELPMRFIYYCKVCKPKIVIMENVPGILSIGKKKGDKEGPYPIWLREKFNEAGYDMEYKTLDAADYGVPQRRKRVFFFATRKDVKINDLFPKATHGEHLQTAITVLEAIGHMVPLNAGETWGKDRFQAYGYNPREGYVICPSCLQYCKEERFECQNCGSNMSEPIRSGVLRVPGMGVLIGTKTPIDNNELRELTESIYKNIKNQENG